MISTIRPEQPTELISRSKTLAELVAMLDSWGFDIGATRVSVWSALLVILIITGVFVGARLASSFVRKLFARMTQLDPGQQLLGEKLVSIFVWAVAILIGIDLIGLDLKALTIFSGALGLAVGFGLQKTFGNLIAGIILLMDRSIKPGDVIAVNDPAGSTFGQVKKIGMRAVSVTTRDKREYLIPNENLMVNQVENWSYSSREVRFQVNAGVAYGSDIDLAEKLMLQAASEVPRILKTPAPVVWMSAFGDNALEFVIHCWIIDPEDGLGNVRSDVLKRLYNLFVEHGIGIPYPQRDLHLQDSATARDLIAAIKHRAEADRG